MTLLISGATVVRSAVAAEPDMSLAPQAPQTLEQRLDESDQRGRIALRKLELLEEAAATKEKDRPVVKVGTSGLSVASADGAYSVAVRGLFQADGRIFVNDEHRLTDTMLVRRARPILDATFAKIISLRIMPDFGGGQAVLSDAYVTVKPAKEFGVTVGKFRPSVGLERGQAESATYFIERGYPSSLVPGRDVGVAVHGEFADGKLGYNVGFFNGVVDGSTSGDIDVDDSKEFTAHLYTRPLAVAPPKDPKDAKEPPLLSGLFIGVAATRGEKTGTATNTYLPTYRTTGLNTFFSYITDASATAPPGSTAVAAGVQNRFTGHIYAPVGPVAFLGEYILSQQRVARLGNSKLLTHQAWNFILAVALTGESAKFDGIAPKHPLDASKGHWGAAEVALRYGALALDRDAFNDVALDTRSARLASEVGGGINWYATKNFRVTADYFFTDFRSGAAATAGARRDVEQVFLLRNQVAF